jgi:hypothetical protein
MSKKPIESEILKDMLRVATEKWGVDKIEELRPSLETIAKAIFEVESFRLALEEEPASATTASQQQNCRKKVKER